MRAWFARGPVTDPADAPVGRLQAYKEGRADERQRLQKDGGRVDQAANDAYDRGRRDERALHRGSPFLAVLSFVCVVISLIVLTLAAKTGSFTSAGAVLDRLVQNQAQTAADKAGAALENAGRNLKDSAAPAKP